LPISLAAYAVGWWGIAHADGILGLVLPFLWIASYYLVFWGGWVGIPLLGIGATLLQSSLPPRARRPTREWFVGWLVAWLGALVGVLWLGAPPGFEVVGTG